MEKEKTGNEKRPNPKKPGGEKFAPILLKEGDLCPHCKMGHIKRGGNGDLECDLCGYGRVPRRC